MSNPFRMWTLAAHFDFDGNFLKFGGEKHINGDNDARIGIWMIKDSKHDKFFTRYDFGKGD